MYAELTSCTKQLTHQIVLLPSSIAFDELNVTVDNMNRTVNEGDILDLCVNLSSSYYDFSFNVIATAVFNDTANCKCS